MSINKSQTILDVGQRLTQTRGYNAFSYADIAEQVRIRKASIHYYYPSKADLGRKLVMRYRRVMRQRLQAIEAQSTYPVEPLRGLVTIFSRGFARGQSLSGQYAFSGIYHPTWHSSDRSTGIFCRYGNLGSTGYSIRPRERIFWSRKGCKNFCPQPTGRVAGCPNGLSHGARSVHSV
jgi:hypothetical protein